MFGVLASLRLPRQAVQSFRSSTAMNNTLGRFLGPSPARPKPGVISSTARTGAQRRMAFLQESGSADGQRRGSILDLLQRHHILLFLGRKGVGVCPRELPCYT